MSIEVQQVKINTLRNLLEKSKGQILAALPAHVTPERMMRIALTEANKNPKLFECDQASFLGAVIQAAQLGLEPGGALGQCYLIPFFNGKKKIYEVQFMIGYRGMLDLAYRSDRVSHVVARAVYENDYFEYDFGLNEKCTHKPGVNSPDAKITHVYCIIFLKNGGKLFDVMSKAEVDEIRKRSKTGDFGPWSTDYGAMASKTVIRRLFKLSPVSVEIQTAVGLDEMNDAGISQNNNSIFETTGKHITNEVKDSFEAAIGLDEEDDEPGSFSKSQSTVIGEK